MLELLRDTRRYADYLRLLGERWDAYMRLGYGWPGRDDARDAYEDCSEEFTGFVLTIGERLPACVVDRIDRIAYRSVYGGVS